MNGAGGDRRLNCATARMTPTPTGRHAAGAGAMSPCYATRNGAPGFVANVSHELRTPVTSVKGFAEALLTGRWTIQKKQSGLCRSSCQSNHLESIISDLLELSHESAVSRSTSRKHPQRDRPACGRVAADAEDERGVTLAVTCGAELTVRGCGAIEQALVNLIDNAIKYGVNGGVTASRSMLCRRGRQYASPLGLAIVKHIAQLHGGTVR